MRHRVVFFLVFVLLFCVCSCAGKEYVPQMSSEQAIACALEEGEQEWYHFDMHVAVGCEDCSVF